MMYNSTSKVQSTGYMRTVARVLKLVLLHIMTPFLTSQHGGCNVKPGREVLQMLLDRQMITSLPSEVVDSGRRAYDMTMKSLHQLDVMFWWYPLGPCTLVN